ncbi:MAG TPA: sigma-54 dependent transcriptional regulator [Polyangiales bacterium]
MPKILIVDDNPGVQESLKLLFELHGMDTIAASSPGEALAVIGREAVAVVLQDMNFERDTTSGAEGEELMRAIRVLDPAMPVLLMTAFTSLETAVRLVREGASDYIAKPWNNEKLLATVRNLIALRALSDENEYRRHERSRARSALANRADLRGLVYESLAMHELVSLAVRVASSDLPVLILGPNGAGKEKIAEIVQANSRRAQKPFVRVNAGGLPDQLLEAELFGAEAGAFTGAARARIGRFEEAHGGTLFLDEIGNLSVTGQMKLLRVLQSGELQRLGSNQTRRADVRVISATNVDLARAVRAGTFREDLYFRLNVMELILPPLRDRSGDILVLAEHFLAEANREADRASTLTAEAREMLLDHDWPGNVRELQNRVRRAVTVSTSELISPIDLGLAGRTSELEAAPVAGQPSAREEERRALEKLLADSGGVVAKAAASLGISRQALYRRMQRVGLHIERSFKSET